VLYRDLGHVAPSPAAVTCIASSLHYSLIPIPARVEVAVDLCAIVDNYLKRDLATYLYGL
jgi:hypothetical protein